MMPHIQERYDEARSLENKAFRSACYAPFVSMFFTTQGQVLACCKNGSYVLGNVKEQRLRDIWTGEKTHALREALRQYRFNLDCDFCEWEINGITGGNYQTATPLLFDEFAVPSPVPEWPVQIEFEGSNTCNFECIMCNGDTSSSIRAHRDGLPALPRPYGDAFFEDIRPFLPHLKRARFFGGEPFLTPESRRIWEMMIEDGLSTECHVTTNGSQYNERIERYLESLPFHLVVSLDGATKQTLEQIRVNSRFEQVVENIHRFRDYAGRRGTSFHIAFCLMRQNWHEFGDLLLFAESLGVEAWVNTVIDPAFCSLYTLPRSERARVVEALTRQEITLLDRLELNRTAWVETLRKLRSSDASGQAQRMTEMLDRFYVQDDAVQKATVLVREGRYGDALAMARTVSESEPVYYKALNLRGYSQNMLGDLDGAERDLTRALDVTRKRPEALLNMARLSAKQNRLREAHEYALQAERHVQPETKIHYEVSEVLAFISARRGRLLQAYRALRPIVELQARRSPIAGSVYPADGLRREVVAELESNPKRPWARLNKRLVSSLLSAGRLELTRRENPGSISPLRTARSWLSKRRGRRPLVSVVTPFLNAETFMREAVESVLAQTYKNWELILVDDGSTDGSTAIARQYAADHPGRIFYVEHENHENRGGSASRNVGIRRARGEYVAMLDSDDVWLPEKLERQVAILEAEPRAALVCGPSLYWHGWTGDASDLSKDNVRHLGVEPDKLYEPPDLLELLYPLGGAGAPCPSNLLLRRSLLVPEGGFEEEFRGIYFLYEDQAFLVKTYLAHPVYISSECLDKYRIHPDSCMSKVKGAGQYDTVRNYFLTWFGNYLVEHGFKDTPAWDTYQEALVANSNLTQLESGITRRKRWFLRQAGENRASLVYLSDDREAVRVVIGKASSRVAYDIQLNLPRLSAKAGSRYRVAFKARAEAPRTVGLGFARAGDPWTNLGLYQTKEFTPEWTEFVEEFVASDDEENARIHFDLGESDAMVELSSWVFGEVVEIEEGTDEPLETDSPEGESTGVAPAPKPSGSGVPAAVGVAVAGRAVRVIDQNVQRDDVPASNDWGWDRGLPIDRHYIQEFLHQHADDIKGAVLEIGDDVYARMYGGERLTSADILDINEENPRATIIADLTRADAIPDDSYDCLIVPQTLQFTYDLNAAVGTLHRILKPGGTLLVTMPGTTRTVENDPSGTWYWSFTPASARRLFEEAFAGGEVSVRTYGSFVTAISFLRGLATEELTDEELNMDDPDYTVIVAARAVKGRDRR